LISGLKKIRVRLSFERGDDDQTEKDRSHSRAGHRGRVGPVRLGGEDGTTVELHAGDVVVIPAGVAHKNEGASPDLVVVGAYPGGKGPDMCSPGAQHRERALRNVREVPLPASDPVYGKPGPLIERWRAVSRG
jgi:uncharacterized protein YjlB